MTQGLLLSHTDDLTSDPYDIATVSLSYMDDLLTPLYDIRSAAISYGRLNISS